VTNLYHIVKLLEDQDVTKNIAKKLKLTIPKTRPVYTNWVKMAKKVDEYASHEVVIAMVGKYTGTSDSYLSVVKAIDHAAFANQVKPVIRWIEAANLEPKAEKYAEAWATLKAADGILVPGGFGIRGIEGKILGTQYAREKKVPFLGVCLGMQVAVIEYARNICGKKGANSTEFDPKTKHPAIIFMPEGSKTHMGGTMRLGSRQTNLQSRNCHAFRLYNSLEVHERHRHRYEVNPSMINDLEAAGLKFVG
jgi:CTP synthase